MTHDIKGPHHQHVRKRIHLKHEPYPHPNKLKRFIDKAIYFVGMFGPIMTVPQITTIWIEKNASGVSAISWAAYLVVAIFWLFYGIVHREKPIILLNIVWIVLEILIISGVMLYG